MRVPDEPRMLTHGPRTNDRYKSDTARSQEYARFALAAHL